MATLFDNAVITNAGENLLQRAQRGETTITLTGAALGSGVWTQEDNMKTATALKSAKNTYNISNSSIDADTGNLIIKILMVNAESGSSIVQEDYEMTEIGIYAKDSDNNTILYGIGVPTGEPDVMPVFDGNNLMQIEESWAIVIGEATVTVDYTGAVALASDLQALAAIVAAHEAEIVASETGAHGLKYDDDKLYVKENNVWKEAASSGGSMVTVTTEEALLLNKTCTLAIGGTTYTGTISALGICTFDGIKETGTATITANNGTSDVTESISIPYYGEYDVELFDGVAMVINISTSESTLYGQTATITYGGNSKNVLLGADGSATTKVKYGSDGTMTVTATDGDQTATTEVSIASGTTTYNVSLSFVQIYGVTWDGSSTTAWSRTDDAASFTDPVPALSSGSCSSPFDDKFPWSEMTVSTRDAGSMVKIPKFWYKLEANGNGLKIQIADGAKTGFSVCPACMDRGDGSGERDAIYVGRYHCATSTYKSTSGVKPAANATRSAMRSSIHNLGSKIWQMDFATRFTIWLLYIVEFADWNSQAKIGYGCGNNSATENMGYTDGMTGHTGTTQSSRTTYGLGTQYRNIEGLWDNVFDWLDGCYYDSSGMHVILNPSSFSDSTGGTVIGTPSNGYPKKFGVSTAAGFPMFYPTEAGGSDSTYSCDNWGFNASNPCLYAGGNYNQNLNQGLFYVNNTSATNSNANHGCRILLEIDLAKSSSYSFGNFYGARFRTPLGEDELIRGELVPSSERGKTRIAKRRT